ncbi:MAG: FKBP-type peptidyl-prolyl cis-trans isomerase [Oscillospiraceae bacterium]|nr:FKBP-type peptidyl-prolyl cis-trans isomerase [Oscillospiraceae bacterium]
MKKTISLLLALSLLAGFTGCKKDTAFSYSGGLTAEGYFEGVTASKYVTLPDYKNLVIPSEESAVSDEDIQTEVQSLLSQFSDFERITDRAVADGDTVSIDYVGSIDGVEFSGGSTGGAGTEVTVGVTSYIDDFIEQLIGRKPGETFNVEVTFPDSYPQNTDLQGKDAVFVTTINYIRGADVVPEWNDAFVEQNLKSYYGYGTTAEVESLIRSSLTEQNESAYVKTWLVENSTFKKNLPKQMRSYEENFMIDYYEKAAQQYGMDLETYLSYAEDVSSTKELIEANTDRIDEEVRFYVAVQAVAEAEGMTVSEQDIANYFLLYIGTTDSSSYISYYGEPYVKWYVLQNKVITQLTSDAARA